MTTTVEVLNADKLLRKLQALPAATRSRIEHAMADQADEIVDFARRLVPVRSGALRSSITWHWGTKVPAGAMSLGTVKAPTGFGGELTLTIVAGNSEAYYSRWVEFGTTKMAKQPFSSRHTGRSARRRRTRSGWRCGRRRAKWRRASGSDRRAPPA